MDVQVLHVVLAKRVLRNIMFNSSSILVSNVAGLFISIYLARVLQSKLFGVYSLTLSLTFLLLVFTDLGVNATTVRFCAKAYSKRDFGEVRGLIDFLFRVKVILSISTALALFIFSDALSKYVFREEVLSTTLKIASFIALFFPLSGFLTSIFNAFNDFKANFVKAITYESTRVVSIAILVSLGFSVFGALLGYVIASVASTIALAVLLLKNYGEVLRVEAKGIKRRKVIRFASYLTIGSVTWTIFAYVDSVMIGYFMPVEYVGFYRIAHLVVSAISGILSIPGVLFPVFVALEGEDLKLAFKRAFKYSAVISVPTVFALPIIAKPIVKVAFGEEYLQAVSALWILSFLILRASLGFWAQIFNAKGKPEHPVYVLLVAMILNVILNYLLIPPLGIKGAALATVISNFFNWIVLAYLSKKYFDVFFEISDVAKPVLASLVMLLILLNLKPTTIFEGIGLIVAGAVVYFAALAIIGGIRREDIIYLWKTFK